MITLEIENFDLGQIAASGQCFRMVPAEDEKNTYTLISGGKFLEISQQQKLVTFCCPGEDMPYWKDYFDLDTDYASMIASVDPKDTYLLHAAAFGDGIRILHQDTWEMIITFIISQQKTIPAIQSLVHTLCSRYGTPLVPVPCCDKVRALETLYAFPTPKQLGEASLEDLQELKLGYRAKYIKRICEDACSGALDLTRLSTLDYRPAMEYLQSFYGIGEKVANCICLFSLHHIDAFPVDTWIRKILLREYARRYRGIHKLPQCRVCETLVQKYFSRYHGYAGVMQQYMFFYERSYSSKK